MSDHDAPPDGRRGTAHNFVTERRGLLGRRPKALRLLAYAYSHFRRRMGGPPADAMSDAMPAAAIAATTSVAVLSPERSK